jgi:hypothetical protein
MKRNIQLHMPAASGVGPISANFGAAGYPFKGHYLAIFQPKNIVASGSNITSWPSTEGSLVLSPVGAVVTGTMPDGHSKCASFALATDALAVTSASLNPLGGVNTPWLMVNDFVIDTNNSGARAVWIADVTTNLRISDWQTEIGGNAETVTRTDGVATNAAIIPPPKVVGTRLIKGYILDNTPNAYGYDCNPNTGIITEGVAVSITTAINMAGINNLTYNGFASTGGGDVGRLANLYIKLPAASDHASMVRELTSIMEYIRSNPNG